MFGCEPNDAGCDSRPLPQITKGFVKLFFDTEFIDRIPETGGVIPLAIGVVRADGATFYAEVEEGLKCKDLAVPWVQENVLKILTGPIMPCDEIRMRLLGFANEGMGRPEWWGYFADCDFMALCHIMGGWDRWPGNWVQPVMDIAQLKRHLGVRELPNQKTVKHHALNDALWTKECYEYLMNFQNYDMFVKQKGL